MNKHVKILKIRGQWNVYYRWDDYGSSKIFPNWRDAIDFVGDFMSELNDYTDEQLQTELNRRERLNKYRRRSDAIPTERRNVLL